MANRTFLIASDNLESFCDFDEDKILCAASYMVPLFWYSLFDEADIQETILTGEDGEPDFKYHRLVTTPGEGIERSYSRLPALNEMFRDEILPLVSDWRDFIEKAEGKYIYIETCELVMMDEDYKAYYKQAKNCVSAFNEPFIVTKGVFKKTQEANPKWAELFGQAEISSFDTLPELASLFGYSWHRDVPWEAKNA